MKDLSSRTIAILSAVLCNFSVIGIQVGGFAAFAPSRKKAVLN